MTEKSVFRKAFKSPEMMYNHPQSPVFGLMEVKFDAYGTSKQWKEKSLSKYLFCFSYRYIVEILSSE